MYKVLVGLCLLLALSSIEAKKSTKNFSLILIISCHKLSFSLGRAIQNFYCNDNVNKQIKMEFDASNIYLSLVRE